MIGTHEKLSLVCVDTEYILQSTHFEEIYPLKKVCFVEYEIQDLRAVRQLQHVTRRK